MEPGVETIQHKRVLHPLERRKEPIRRTPFEIKVGGHVDGFRRRLYQLENWIKDSPNPEGRKAALAEIIGLAGRTQARLATADEMRRGSRDGERERLSTMAAGMRECYEACCFALERLTDSNDREVRNAAFDFIRDNSISVRMAFLISSHRDIKERAREMFPRKPDRHYAAIGMEEHTDEHVGQARLLLSAFRKDGAGSESALALLDTVRESINERRRRSGRKEVTDKELVSSAKRYLSGKASASASELGDALRRAAREGRAQFPDAPEAQ